MGIGSILSGIGAASSILGGLSGNKQKAMPGTQIRPMEEQLSEMDKLRQYLAQNTSYNARPTRRLTAPELEGVFAPVAVREIQNYFDSQYPGQSAYGGTQEQEAAAVSDAGSFSPADEVFIKQYESGQLPQNQYAMQYQDALKRREAAGKVPMPMGGYMPAPAGAVSKPNPLTEDELAMLRTMMTSQGAA